MKYTGHIDINKPLNDVFEFWKNSENNHLWQDGFVKITLLEGKEHEVGAKSEILLKHGKNDMLLTETVLAVNFPYEKEALYEHKHMSNTQKTIFEEISETKTRYKTEVEYVKFNGFLPKLMGKLFPSMFRKQSEKWMTQFKEACEKK